MQRLTAEGVRSVHRDRVPTAMVGEMRRARGQRSLTEQFRTQAKFEEQWTMFDLAQELGCIAPGSIRVSAMEPYLPPATRCADST